MSIAPSFEERLTIVEKEIRELKQVKAPHSLKHNWLEKIAGSFKDDPEFGDILRLGQEIRKSEKMDGTNGDT